MRLVGSAAFKAVGTSDPRPAGSIPVHLRHLLRCVGFVVLLLVTWPIGAASADPAQPGNTESIVDRIDPPTDAVTADIVGGDAFLRIHVSAGHEVDVTGYDDEPYLRIAADGTVYLNEWSPTGVLNESRYGGSQDPLPEYDPDQEPVWKKIGTGGTAMWHDHRVHWMSPLTPAAIDDNGLVQQWFVPVTLDGVASTISGSLYVRGAPAPVWWVLAVPAGVIGARLYHVITDWERFDDDPGKIIEIWKGGLGIWGGIALGVLVGVLVAKRRGLPLAGSLTCVAPALAFAQAIGRWGNWFNQELFGRPTTLPWGLEVSASTAIDAGYDPGTLFHPTFLYESIGCALLGFGLIAFEKRKQLRDGVLFAWYTAGYTAMRFFIEGLRVDPAHDVGGLRLNQWVSLAVFAASVVVIVVMSRPRDEAMAEVAQ